MKFGEYILREAVDDDSETCREILETVLAEYGLAPDFENTDRDLYDVSRYYSSRGGVFFVVETLSGEVLGTAGLMRLDDQTAELRKMYFQRELRGKGMGKVLLTFLIEEAKRRGFLQIALETNSKLKEAIGLYKSFGFEPSGETHADRCDAAFLLRIN